MDAAPSNEDRAQAIRGFVLGCCERITQRLVELVEKSATVASSNAKALVVIKDQAIKAKLDEMGIRLCAGSSSLGAYDGSSYQAGKAAGDRASFGRPVSGRNSTLRLR
jgi:hypothetical protein